VDEEIRQKIIDLHAAMSDEKLGRFQQPRIDRIENAIIRLATAMGPDVEQQVRTALQAS
jgi:hypothetical protein